MSFVSMKNLLLHLKKGKIVVYPTESIFGLGCDPDNEDAIYTLLDIKKRSWKKGLILVAANYEQLLKYVADDDLNVQQRSRILTVWPIPITWLVPARINVPYWITGQFSFLAVRISNFELICRICLAFGKPLVSTSANLSGYPPARSLVEVYKQLGGDNFFKMYRVSGVLGGFFKPSEIRNVFTGELIRA